MTAIAIPAWFLRTFGSGSSVDALLGDLREEYQQGKSAAWFWGQAITGVAVTFITEVRSHWLVTLRAVALAWLIKYVFVAITITWLPWIRFALAVYLPDSEPVTNSMFVAMVFLSGCAPLATGWLVGRAHRHHRTSSVLAAALTFFAIDVVALWALWTQPPGVSGIAPGWLIIWQHARVLVILALFMAGGLGRRARSESRSLA